MLHLYDSLERDVRYIEGLKSCINCGVCTAICPAAEVSDYDPRIIVNTVQQRDENELEKLLKSDTIWRCGECLSYLLKSNRSYSVTNSKKKFDSMKPYNPDLIIANCPGCTFFLDRWQYVIAEMEGITYGQNGYGIPVLTYEEIAGLLLGYNPWDIGLQTHQVAVEPLLEKLGIEYNPEDKYNGIDGEDLGRPELPQVLRC